MMIILAPYIAVLGLILLALIFNVIKHRRKFHVALGDGGFEDLQRAIRAHGNFMEIVPMILIIMLVLAALQASLYLLHLLGIMLVAGRIIHARAIMRGSIPQRQLGMALGTMTPLILGIIGLFAYAL